MNENIDLTKILKNCPKGWEFYSSVLGEVEFVRICDDDKLECPIIVKPVDFGYTDGYTKKGFYYKNKGECTLFPSKDQRDWSKFSAPWYKKEKFNPKTLQPFDKILIRRYDNVWVATLLSHYEKIHVIESDIHYIEFTTINNGTYRHCIPYNDDTKHLVGTKCQVPEYYKYWED